MDSYYAWSFFEKSSYRGEFETINQALDDVCQKAKNDKLAKKVYIAHIKMIREGMYRMMAVYEYDLKSLLEDKNAEP